MGLGDDQWPLEAELRGFQNSARSEQAVAADAHGFYVYVRVSRVSAQHVGWVQLDSAVQKALARDVVIDADDVGGARLGLEGRQFALGSARTA